MAGLFYAYFYAMANRLINEQSPYLLQHAHNPVDWYAWGDEPFEEAKRLNKPVLVSIGYAACHWCHVMERESFENEEVAAYMNEHFINIKVDREEHPDVDHMYMDAVQAISGSGGWPLNVFVTPDRMPFYGGTYYPPRQAFNRPAWTQLLQRIKELWDTQPEEIAGQAKQMVQHLRQASNIGTAGKGKEWDLDTCRSMADELLRQADKEHGGFGGAPKFPGTMAISFLLEHYHFTGYKPALDHALHSLDAMMQGGLYDQLGGGFARYATDNEWLVPHFEKMLYDNALLIISYCDAYYINRDERYKHVIDETIAFVERELKDITGGYYSALDADSEGEEGKFYTWTWQEWQQAIGDDQIPALYFGVTEEGNWEGTNILHIASDITAIAVHTGQPPAAIEASIQKAKQSLLAHRAHKTRPSTDDKSLLSWNALMNTALSAAATALQNEAYTQRAEEHMQWMLDSFQIGDKLYHSWKAGKAKIAAHLDDYAYLIRALLQLACTSGNNDWILHANALAQQVEANFAHEKSVFFYFTSKEQNHIPVRKVDLYDGATPAANSVLAHSFMLLGLCMDRPDWTERAQHMLAAMVEPALRYGYSFGNWGIQLQRSAIGIKTVISTGPGADDNRKKLQQQLLPQCYTLSTGEVDTDIPVFEDKVFSTESLIFVCTQQECLYPAHDIEETLRLISL